MKIYAYVDKTRANADKTFPVYIIVNNQHGRFFVNTGITTSDRLIKGVAFPKTDKQSSLKTTLLGKYLADISSICLRQELADVDNKTLKEMIRKEVFGIVKKEQPKTLADYIEDFAKTKRTSTATLYRITARKVREHSPTMTLDAVDTEWLKRFRQWNINNGMKINGTGKELRNIRAVFNWSRKKGYTSNYPFLDYSIPEEETKPNNLSAEDICRLRDYPCEEWQKKYVDFFMLSFYLAGINPGDLLMLRKDAVKNGHVSFVRKKTDKQGAKKIRTITLPLVDEALQIIRKYPSQEGYLLGFMDGRSDYHSFIKRCNEALKKVGESQIKADRVGKMRKVEYHPIFPGITLYTARYSFGSIAANDLDISEQTIGQCLGHSWSKRVTARYIATDQKKIDKTVRKVVKFIAER